MNVTLKLYASLSDYLPADARHNQVARYRLPPKLTHLVLVNGAYVAPDARATKALRDGDQLAVWPPIAGG
jgi:sulfur carrier protein ThiS